MKNQKIILTTKKIWVVLLLAIILCFPAQYLLACNNDNQDASIDAFLTFRNYIIENGSYDSNDKEYTLNVGSSYSSTFVRKFSYDVVDEEIKLMVFVSTNYYFVLELKTASGLYTWGYIDKDNNFMVGDLNASNYVLNDLLEYTRSNISSSQVKTSVNKIASEMASYLIKNLDSDLSLMGLSTVDFGFVLIK